MSNQAVDQILRPREVIKLTGLSRTTLWRGVSAGTFPRPVRLTSGTIGWCQADVAEWQAKLRAAAGLPDEL
ncbi:AlpA family phage regulatory protein [Bradyrhizobium japonicum]|uniref:helix-turn-helix transcriptional regulator n=1 Tax=Bradyrhizobium japonicum TaxID=375 RepID=UPI001BACAFBF|nr:AlpA family phage regulatory protein [Bradyrhizobium japonicum]MBR0749115.1 AlpA family phage regulatory protein [Bradyrhizobium japonicum]